MKFHRFTEDNYDHSSYGDLQSRKGQSGGLQKGENEQHYNKRSTCR